MKRLIPLVLLACTACHGQQPKPAQSGEQAPTFTQEQKKVIVRANDAMNQANELVKQANDMVSKVCVAPKWRFNMISKPKADGTGLDLEPGCELAPPPAPAPPPAEKK